ncbi:hypothetical protein KCP74_02960 [Salmonella enterica subsp. enterica]|nr:hypothetical protein KCP74_02960 [Salmonella enterica subsp. enterica]
MAAYIERQIANRQFTFTTVIGNGGGAVAHARGEGFAPGCHRMGRSGLKTMLSGTRCRNAITTCREPSVCAAV